MTTPAIEESFQSVQSDRMTFDLPCSRMLKTLVVAVMLCCAMIGALPSIALANGLCDGDELWIINTRCLSSEACRINLDTPELAISLLDSQSKFQTSDLPAMLNAINSDEGIENVIYAHGNRFTQNEAIERAWYVYRNISRSRKTGVRIRFILFSWPSAQQGILLNDARIKAERTDAQGLYLAWLLRQTIEAPSGLTLIGYSFGGRVITGALHALAGGSLGGRRLPGEHLTGYGARVGLIAAAIDHEWLEYNEYHGLATKNMDHMTLMYNPRDTVLRKYWLLDPATISRALGAVGPMKFARRSDGSPLPVISINCSRTVGRQHDELDYFSADCRAGRHLAALIENR